MGGRPRTRKLYALNSVSAKAGELQRRDINAAPGLCGLSGLKALRGRHRPRHPSEHGHRGLSGLKARDCSAQGNALGRVPAAIRCGLKGRDTVGATKRSWKGRETLAQSLSRVLVHLIFSTKNREPVLVAEIRTELHSYLAGVLREEQCPALQVGGAADHVHLLFGLSRTVTGGQG